jgi:primosomal protein N'
MEGASLASEKVILIGEGQKELLSSFKGWNYVFPAWDLEEKRKAKMPPFRAALNIWGAGKEVQKSVKEVLKALKAPEGEFEIMGPVPISNPEEYLCVLFIPPPFADALGEAVSSVSRLRAAPAAHFWIDPYCLGRR